MPNNDDLLPNERELLPCPFCGSQNISCEVLDDGWKFVEVCRRCKARGATYRTLVEALKGWNTRFYQPRVSEQVESEPMIYECVFTRGKHDGMTVKVIAFNDTSVENWLNGDGYINGCGSLIGNGFGYIARER